MIWLVAASIIATLVTLFGLWRTWRHGYTTGYQAGLLDGIDLLAEEIADDLPN